MKINYKKAVYEGDAAFRGLQWEPHGYGMKSFNNGATYVGGHCWGKYHGYGKLIITPNEYMGRLFAAGKLNGQGHHFRHRPLFMGNFYTGIPDGYGTFYFPNGTTWTGMVYHGHAVLYPFGTPL